eukprot:11493790-Ditylum_brightwellii.AAC.1
MWRRGGNSNDVMDDEEMDVVDEAFLYDAHENLIFVGRDSVNPEEEVADDILNSRRFKKRDQQTSLDLFILIPNLLNVEYFKTNREAQNKFAQYMVTFGARTYWKEQMQWVSPYLDVAVLQDQVLLLSPSVLDIITGYLIEDRGGARKCLPTGKINTIDGYISS